MATTESRADQYVVQRPPEDDYWEEEAFLNELGKAQKYIDAQDKIIKELKAELANTKSDLEKVSNSLSKRKKKGSADKSEDPNKSEISSIAGRFLGERGLCWIRNEVFYHTTSKPISHIDHPERWGENSKWDALDGLSIDLQYCTPLSLISRLEHVRKERSSDGLVESFIDELQAHRQTGLHRLRQNFERIFKGYDVSMEESRNKLLCFPDTSLKDNIFSPIFFPDCIMDPAKIFQNEVLPRVAVCLFFGDSALKQLDDPKEKVNTKRSKGELWGLKKATPGMIALCAMLARFLLTKDREFVQEKTESGLNPSEEKNIYHALLVDIGQNGGTKDLFAFFNSVVFKDEKRQSGSADGRPAQTSQGGSVLARDIAAIRLAFAQPNQQAADGEMTSAMGGLDINASNVGGFETEPMQDDISPWHEPVSDSITPYAQTTDSTSSSNMSAAPPPVPRASRPRIVSGSRDTGLPSHTNVAESSNCNTGVTPQSNLLRSALRTSSFRTPQPSQRRRQVSFAEDQEDFTAEIAAVEEEAEDDEGDEDGDGDEDYSKSKHGQDDDEEYEPSIAEDTSQDRIDPRLAVREVVISSGSRPKPVPKAPQFINIDETPTVRVPRAMAPPAILVSKPSQPSGAAVRIGENGAGGTAMLRGTNVGGGRARGGGRGGRRGGRPANTTATGTQNSESYEPSEVSSTSTAVASTRSTRSRSRGQANS